MPKAELTFTIDGDVEIDDFVKRIRKFDAVVRRLLHELKVPRRDWIITDMDGGSATTTIGATFDSQELVDYIGMSYIELGTEASAERPSVISRFSPKLLSDARAIAASNGHMHDVKFIVGKEEVSLIPESERINLPTRGLAYGEIRGTAETASIHNRQYFTVFELTRGWPVRCYPKVPDLELLRNTLGTTVIVTGMVRRNMETGRPIDVQAATIETVESVEPDAWKKAIGLVPVSPDSLSAEDAIRRFRDA